MRTLFGIAPVALLFGMSSCGPSLPIGGTTPAATATVAVASKTPVRVFAEVAEPYGIFAVARISSVNKILDNLTKIGAVPLSLSSILQSEIRKAKLDVLHLDSSIDMVMSLDERSTDDDPQVLAAISIPLRDFEAAKALLTSNGVELAPIAAGVFRISVDLDHLGETDGGTTQAPDAGIDAAGDLSTDTPKERTRCDLSVATGEAPARLICAVRERDLDVLRPWLTQRLPLERMSMTELHSEFRFEPIRDRYLPVMTQKSQAWNALATQWLSDEAKISDPNLLAVPSVVIDETIKGFDDLDRMDFDVKFDSTGNRIVGRGGLQFRGRSSWFTELMVERNDSASTPPAIFWKAPKDSLAVQYAVGSNPKLFEGANKTLRLAISTLLPRVPISAASRTAVEDWVDSSMMKTKLSVVIAQGMIATKPKAVGSKARTPKNAVASTVEYVNRTIGWELVGAEAGAEASQTWLRKTVALYNRLLTEGRGNKDIAKDLKGLSYIPEVRLVNNPVGYPSGTLAADFTVKFDSRQAWIFGTGPEEHPKGPAVKGSVTLRIVSVPDGPNRTWFGWSADDETLRRQLSAVMQSSSDSGTIATMPELAPLRDGRVTGAGYVVYGRALQEAFRSFSDKETKELKAMEELFDAFVNAAPNRLMTPIFVRTTGNSGPKPSVSWEVEVQQGTVQDWMGMIQFGISAKGREMIDRVDTPSTPASP